MRADDRISVQVLLSRRWPNRKCNGARFLKGWWRWRSAEQPVTWRTGEALLPLFTSRKTHVLTQPRRQSSSLYSALFGDGDCGEPPPPPDAARPHGKCSPLLPSLRARPTLLLRSWTSTFRMEPKKNTPKTRRNA